MRIGSNVFFDATEELALSYSSIDGDELNEPRVAFSVGRLTMFLYPKQAKQLATWMLDIVQDLDMDNESDLDLFNVEFPDTEEVK